MFKCMYVSALYTSHMPDMRAVYSCIWEVLVIHIGTNNFLGNIYPPFLRQKDEKITALLGSVSFKNAIDRRHLYCRSGEFGKTYYFAALPGHETIFSSLLLILFCCTYTRLTELACTKITIEPFCFSSHT